MRGDVQVLASGPGKMTIWLGREAFQIDGIPPEFMDSLVPLLDGHLDQAGVVRSLAPAWTAGQVASALEALRAVGCLQSPAERTPEPHAAMSSVVVVGDGALAAACAETIGEQGCRVDRGTQFQASATGMPALAICAIEDVPLSTLFEFDEAATRAGTPVCFVTALGGGEIAIGPTVGSAAGPCIVCAQLALRPGAAPAEIDRLRALTVADDRMIDAALLARAARCAADEAVAASGKPPSFPLAARIRILRAHQDGEGLRLLPRGDCPRCGKAPACGHEPLPQPLREADLLVVRRAAVAIGQVWPATPQQPLPDGERPYRTVGIVGGGTAGYLTALALRRSRPELEVTLIESSRIPVIGVGEATTPEMVKFLHAPRFLNRPVLDFWRRVQPTWKLGIKFAWGAPPPYAFPFPFQRGRLLESMLYEGHLDYQSLGAMLMASDRAPVFEADGGALSSLIHTVRWAYHLDNRRFVAYLAEEARRAGVIYRDAQVTDAMVDASGERLTGLVLDGEQHASFDLYVDCSGFRSLLLGKALKTPFIDYGATLFTDRAITGDVDNGGTIRPYTLAETYDSGWCWSIPFQGEDHRGYVFSSAFCSDEQAIAEMRAKNPGMTEPKVIRFVSGRHRQLFRGNVIAIGNSYGFVEPLESTALHMIVLSLETLTTHWPASIHDEAIKRTLDRKIGDQWDALRWFLGIHYRFNRRLDTPFWRAANAEADTSGAEERIALFRERAPLSYRSSLFYKVLPPDFFTDDHSFDTLMVGQKVEARAVQPVEARASWRAQQAPLRALARHAVPQARAVAWLVDERPDLLEDFQRRNDSWLHTWLPA